MRYLNDEFAKKNRNFTPADYQKAAEMMAGKSLEDFFDRYVRGTEEIAYNEILNPIGLRLLTGEDGAKKAFLGGVIGETNGRLMVRALPSDTPAYIYGLNTGDEIVAIDGTRASNQFLSYVLSEKKPGDKMRLTIFRREELRDIEVTLEARADPNYRIVPVDSPSENQKRLYKDYLGADLK
jgi:predicted metalloprotease with PDZ domain